MQHHGKRWTYSAMVPCAEVFYTLFNLPVHKSGKEWKQKKLTVDELEDVTGELTASVSLRILYWVPRAQMP